MQTGASLGLKWHSLLWGALLLGLLMFGAPGLNRQLQVRTAPLSPDDPLRSMNHYFNGADNAQRLEAMLSRLPKNRSILIFVQGNPESIFHGVALGYLAWPRPIEMIFADEKAAAERLLHVPPASVAAVAFCNVKSPTWFPIGVFCGPGIRLVCFGEAESHL